MTETSNNSSNDRDIMCNDDMIVQWIADSSKKGGRGNCNSITMQMAKDQHQVLQHCNGGSNNLGNFFD